MERCTTCQYYDRNQRGGEAKAGNAGQCRRSAPALSPVNPKAYMIEGVWPTVRDDDWCGEWKALQRRAVDTARISEALNTPLSTPFAAPAAPAPRVTAQAARAALSALGNELARATVSTLPLTPLPLPNVRNGSGHGND